MGTVGKIVKSMAYITLSQFITRNPKWWAFGSWVGNAYTDNSKYLLEAALDYIKDTDYRFYWVGNEKVKNQLPKDSRVKFLMLNGKDSIPILLRCKFFFATQFPSADICGYNVFHGGEIIFLDHGIPIKKYGTDVVTANGKKYTDIFRQLTGATRKFDYQIASSPLHAAANASGYGYMGVTLGNSVCIGYPRNDYLVNSNITEEIRRVKVQFAKEFDFDPNKKVILYLPTFRWKMENTPSFFFDGNEDNKKKIKSILKLNNAVLIEKSHNRLVRRDIHAKQDEILHDDELILVSKMIDTQELLMMADMMISDYSGCALDYQLLDRPMINYVPDYEDYRDNDTGLLYELEDFAGGPTPRTFEDLLKNIVEFFNGIDNFKEKRARNRERFLTYEHGNASKSICDICTGKKSIDDFCLLR